MVCCAAAALFFGIGSSRFSALAGQGLGANLRKAEYEKLQSYSFTNIDLSGYHHLLQGLQVMLQIFRIQCQQV